MYTQLFGTFLLENNLITRDQLIDAINVQKKKHLRMGTLAIHAGLLTSEEVEHIHTTQTHENKRFGEIALHLGYLTQEQIDSLVSSQKPDYLLLCQALVDLEYMTTAQFEKAMQIYQSLYELTDLDFSNEEFDKVALHIAEFFSINDLADPGYFARYITLFFNNMVRFIGQDFAPLSIGRIEEFSGKYGAYQEILGKYHILTGISMDETTLLSFASRYIGEDFFENDEYTQASMEDFLNLHNGLFAVNLSNDESTDLSLQPPIYEDDLHLHTPTYVIPLAFPFGIINFFFTAL